MAAGVAHMVNAATARMREAYESLFVVVSVCALLLALVVTAEGLLHPAPDGEDYRDIVRRVSAWAADNDADEGESS